MAIVNRDPTCAPFTNKKFAGFLFYARRDEPAQAVRSCTRPLLMNLTNIHILGLSCAGALPWLKDPFEHEQEEPLREVMTVPLLEQLHREARGFALTAALAVGLVRCCRLHTCLPTRCCCTTKACAMGQ